MQSVARPGGLAGIAAIPEELAPCHAGSELAKHPKVKRLYELGNDAKTEEEVEIVYPPELLKQLSEISRNDTSTTNRLKANDLLLKYHDRLQGQGRQLSDTELLNESCKDGHPASVIHAMHYATRLAVTWIPPKDALARLRAVPGYLDIRSGLRG